MYASLFDAPSIKKMFTYKMRSMLLIRNAVVWYSVKKCVNIWNICNSLNSYFPSDQCMVLQNPFKGKDKLMDFNLSKSSSLVYGFEFYIAANS